MALGNEIETKLYLSSVRLVHFPVISGLLVSLDNLSNPKVKG